MKYITSTPIENDVIKNPRYFVDIVYSSADASNTLLSNVANLYHRSICLNAGD